MATTTSSSRMSVTVPSTEDVAVEEEDEEEEEGEGEGEEASSSTSRHSLDGGAAGSSVSETTGALDDVSVTTAKSIRSTTAMSVATAVTTTETSASKATGGAATNHEGTASSSSNNNNNSSNNNSNNNNNNKKSNVSGIHNFDVLLKADEETGILNYYDKNDPSNRQTASTALLSSNGSFAAPHVGNQRFQVTLNMYRHDFETRHNRGQDTSPIVNKLIAIVTEQCVPPGRFLQFTKTKATTTTTTTTTTTARGTEPAGDDDKNNNNNNNNNNNTTNEEQETQPEKEEWVEVPRPMVEEFVERSLLPLRGSAAAAAAPKRNPLSMRNAANNNNYYLGRAAAAPNVSPKSERSRRISFADMETSSPLIVEEEGMDDDGNDNDDDDDDDDDDNNTNDQNQYNYGNPPNSPMPAGLDPPPMFPGQQGLVTDDEKKRRRRSSLLRRSLSDHLLPPAALELFNKKKLNRTTEERRPSLWRAFGKHRMVKQPDALDIVLSFASTSSNLKTSGDDDDNDDNNDVSESSHNTPDAASSSFSLETAELVPNETTGNNRLRVLMQMHKERYSQVSTDKQAKMVQDWVQTVSKFWKARFLKFDKVLESYEVLDAGQVETALAVVMTRMIQGNDYDVSGATRGAEGVASVAAAAAASSTATTLPKQENGLWEITEERSTDSFNSSSDLYSSAGASLNNSRNNSNSQFSVNSAPVYLPSQHAIPVVPTATTFHNMHPPAAGQRHVSAPVMQQQFQQQQQQQQQQKRRSMKDFLPQLPHLGDFTRGVSDSALLYQNRNTNNNMNNLRPQPQDQQDQQQQHRSSVSSRMSVDSLLPDPSILLPGSTSGSVTDVSSMQGMRSAAVESLQRRKKRQGLASRIQKLAQSSLRRASGAISTAAAQAAAASSSSSLSTVGGGNGNNNNNNGGAATNSGTWNDTSSSGLTASQEFPPPPRNILSTSFRRTSVMSTMSSASSNSYNRSVGRPQPQQQHHHQQQQPSHQPHSVQQPQPRRFSKSPMPPMSSLTGAMRRTSASSVSTIGSSRMDAQTCYNEEQIVFGDTNPPPAVFTDPILATNFDDDDDDNHYYGNLPPPPPPPMDHHHEGANHLPLGMMTTTTFTTTATAQGMKGSDSLDNDTTDACVDDAIAMNNLLQEDLLPSPRSSLNKAELDFHDDEDNNNNQGDHITQRQEQHRQQPKEGANSSSSSS
ncbi:hypothetical protein ACA910_015788 [Epithemia clementina (nom. ined.)]